MPKLVAEARKRQLARVDGAKPPTARAAIALAKSQAYQDATDAAATLHAARLCVGSFSPSAATTTPVSGTARCSCSASPRAAPLGTGRARFGARDLDPERAEAAHRALKDRRRRGRRRDRHASRSVTGNLRRNSTDDLAGQVEIAAGPLFRKINRGEKIGASRLSPDAGKADLAKASRASRAERTLAESVSPHRLRAGFVTTAFRNSVPDEEIMGHTHLSLTPCAATSADQPPFARSSCLAAAPSQRW